MNAHEEGKEEESHELFGFTIARERRIQMRNVEVGNRESEEKEGGRSWSFVR
jgi:hypothetical protein